MLFWMCYRIDDTVILRDTIVSEFGSKVRPIITCYADARRAIAGREKKMAYGVYVRGETEPVTHILAYSRLAAEIMGKKMHKDFERVKFVKSNFVLWEDRLVKEIDSISGNHPEEDVISEQSSYVAIG